MLQLMQSSPLPHEGEVLKYKYRLLLQLIVILISTFLFAQESRISVTPIDLGKNWGNFVALHNDTRILASVGLSSPPKLGVLEGHKHRIQQEQQNKSPITTYEIILDQRIFIGFIMLCPFPNPNRAEISYMITPAHQHQGYGKAAVHILCTQILPSAKFPISLWALVPPRNTASQKILFFCGFKVKDDPNLLNDEDMEYELTIN